MNTRFEREQIRLREEVLNAALNIAASDGWSAVSVRGIADRIEYSTTKVYELFKNKNEIVLELLRRGFSLLTEQLEQVREANIPPVEKATSLAVTYCRFAWEHDVYYRIMYGMDGVPFGVAETWQEGMHIGKICSAILKEYLPDYRDTEIEEAVHACWGTLHGLASLYLSGRMYTERDQVERLAVQSVMAIVHK